MTFLLELFDLPRFKKTTQFSSYLGLTPSQHSSGEHVRLGHITRQGNAYLRHVLIESAWTVIKHDHHLREKYYRLRAQGTKANKARLCPAPWPSACDGACSMNANTLLVSVNMIVVLLDMKLYPGDCGVIPKVSDDNFVYQFAASLVFSNEQRACRPSGVMDHE